MRLMLSRLMHQPLDHDHPVKLCFHSANNIADVIPLQNGEISHKFRGCEISDRASVPGPQAHKRLHPRSRDRPVPW